MTKAITLSIVAGVKLKVHQLYPLAILLSDDQDRVQELLRDHAFNSDFDHEWSYHMDPNAEILFGNSVLDATYDRLAGQPTLLTGEQRDNLQDDPDDHVEAWLNILEQIYNRAEPELVRFWFNFIKLVREAEPVLAVATRGEN